MPENFAKIIPWIAIAFLVGILLVSFTGFLERNGGRLKCIAHYKVPECAQVYIPVKWVK